jgi:cytochrome c553
MTITITWKRAVTALVGLAAAGMLVAWSGVIPIAASSGHWPITNWFLHWVMRSSVRTHAAFGTPEEVIDRTGMVSAAGHFAQACASCHGAPGLRPLPVMQGATPHAPNLRINAREWTDRQLFWILDHGIKYTGMPSWPARGRPDEVRRMVALVRAMPTMSPAAYQRLVAIDTRTANAFGRCAGCHGTDGRGRGQPDIPVLAGQKDHYLRAALESYATEKRHSAVMMQAAAQLDRGTMTMLAQRFATMPGLRPAPVSAADRSTAATIVRDGLPRAQLPACQSCHDPAGAKPYPVLRGQRASYIAQRLRQWRGPEGVVEARLSPHTMPVIARRIPEDMIDPVARLLAGE